MDIRTRPFDFTPDRMVRVLFALYQWNILAMAGILMSMGLIAYLLLHQVGSFLVVLVVFAVYLAVVFLAMRSYVRKPANAGLLARRTHRFTPAGVETHLASGPRSDTPWAQVRRVRRVPKHLVLLYRGGAFHAIPLHAFEQPADYAALVAHLKQLRRLR